ncbi:putative transcription regulator mTERF family [Rosa chinensis]|uniref:Putative transcription regulator mTERF family n=1 Tax=Rosa chinensis TaxID=74649 RepID=A0A2P6P542_ROSCH|nr:putative transcription regulator mTERF family [Rosa chinensis]
MYTFEAQKTFKPKIDYLKSVGFSELDIARVLSSEPYILTRSLKNKIAPVLKRLGEFLAVLEPNIDILRSHGVPESLILKFFVDHPPALLLSPYQVSEGIGFVKSLGFSPNNLKFLLALHSAAVMSKALWEQKLETYRSCGMSKDEIYSAFKLQPMCMLVPVKKIHKMMNFFQSKGNLNPSIISKNPNLLRLSLDRLEKSVIPRCSVLHLLLSHDLIRKDIMLFMCSK